MSKVNIQFDVKFSTLKGAPNIIYLDDNGNNIAEEQFEQELGTGYRAGIILIPAASIQLQVGMMTPYGQFTDTDIDPTFIIENYNEYLRRSNSEDVLLNPEEDEFLLGEIFNV